MKKIKFTFIVALFLSLNNFIASAQINKPGPQPQKTKKDTVTKVIIMPEEKNKLQTVPDEIDTVYMKPKPGSRPQDTLYIPPKDKLTIPAPDTSGEYPPKKE